MMPFSITIRVAFGHGCRGVAAVLLAISLPILAPELKAADGTPAGAAVAPAAAAAVPASSPAAPTSVDPAAAATQAILAFDSANKLYEQGKFPDAARAYQQILDGGRRSVTLYFNLGNAWFKAGQTGRAIGAYRQAERLAPRDPSVQFNLNFARKRVVSGEPPAAPILERLLGGLTLDEWTGLTAAAFWFSMVVLAAGEWRESFRATARRYALVGGIATVLGAGAIAGHRALVADHAVVVVPEALLRSGPLDEAKVLFQLRDGTEVEVLDRKQLAGEKAQIWFQVRSRTAQTGWVKQDQLAVVDVR